MKEIKDLQTIINERASVKLHSDLIVFYKHYNILRDKNISFYELKLQYKGKTCSLGDLFSSNSEYYKDLYDSSINLYIESESKLFTNEVEQLKKKVEELQSQIDYMQ